MLLDSLRNFVAMWRQVLCLLSSAARHSFDVVRMCRNACQVVPCCAMQLFYMVRMLRSPLPRTETFLNTLLSEHIICYLPSSRRRWTLTHRAVPLGKRRAAAYRSVLTKPRGRSATTDPRVTFTELKRFLAREFEGLSPRREGGGAFAADACHQCVTMC